MATDGIGSLESRRTIGGIPTVGLECGVELIRALFTPYIPTKHPYARLYLH